MFLLGRVSKAIPPPLPNLFLCRMMPWCVGRGQILMVCGEGSDTDALVCGEGSDTDGVWGGVRY